MPNDEPPRRTVIIDEPASDRDIIARSDLSTRRIGHTTQFLAMVIGGSRPEPVIVEPRQRNAEDRFLERQLASAVDVGLRKVDPLTLDEQAARRHYSNVRANENTIRTRRSKAARRMERRNRRLHRR